MQHLTRAVGITLRAGLVVAAIPILSGVTVTSGRAQEKLGPTTAAPPGGRSISCNEFRDLVKEPDPDKGTPESDTVEKKYARLSEATKAAEACAKAITESFRNLREQGDGKSSWSGIEQALDVFIKGQQSFIDRIEGAGGLIEEAARGESVAQQRIEEAQRNYPDEVDREKERLARLKDIVGATSQQKDVLAQEIRRLQANKPRIAFSEGGKQFDMAIDSLDQFNKVLEGFTKKIPKNQAGSSGM